MPVIVRSTEVVISIGAPFFAVVVKENSCFHQTIQNSIGFGKITSAFAFGTLGNEEMNLLFREFAGAGDWASIRWELVLISRPAVSIIPVVDVIESFIRRHLQSASHECAGMWEGETFLLLTCQQSWPFRYRNSSRCSTR